MLKHDHFVLSNFEGTLDLLVCLIQKEELDISEIWIRDLVKQFFERLMDVDKSLEEGAEFIGTTAYLVWLKSKMLLPHAENDVPDAEDIIEDPRFEIIHHLIDYCRFKQATKELITKQEQQQAYHYRGVEYAEWKKPLGIDHISLEELSQLFQEMVARAPQPPAQIQEESWRVGDKIKAIRRKIKELSSFQLTSLFHSEQTKPEMIVIFLALLELMKIGEIGIGRDSTSTLWVVAKNEEQ